MSPAADALRVWARRLRLLPVAAACAGSAFLTTGVPDAAPAVAGGLWCAVLGVLGILVRRGVRGRRAGVGGAGGVWPVLLVVSLAGAAAAASHVAVVLPTRAAALDIAVDGGRAMAVSGTITSKVEPRADGRLTFDVDAIRIAVGREEHPVAVGIAVRVAPADVDGIAALDVGSFVEVRGTARASRQGDRAALEVTASRGVSVVSAPRGVWAVASDLRRGLVRLSATLPQPGGGLVPGLAVGDTSAVDPALDVAMKASSLSHLTAVSGANCAIVVGLAFALAALAGARRWMRVCAGLTALIGFVLLVTPEPSVVRAGAMAAIAMLAVQLGRTGSGISVLALAVTVLLVGDPWLAWSLGFALSATATASLLLFARPLAAGLERWMPRSLAFVLSVPLAAQLACGPLLVLITPVVPLYGVLANLVAAPAAPVATIVGLAACLAGAFPLLASGLAALAWVPAAWIAATAEVMSALPGNAVPWIEGWWGVAALAMVGVCVGLLTRRRAAADGLRARRVQVAAAALVAVVVGIVGGTATLGSVAGRWTLPSGWAILACDVGQGDAVLIRSDTRVALVDTGPEPAALEDCLARAGIGRVDLLVLTHFDLDHAGGVRVLSGRVDIVLHGPVGEPADARMLAQLAEDGARIVEVSAGMTGMLGEARWRVLWPRPQNTAFPPGNDAGVIVDVRGGRVPTSVYLGDLGASAQRALLASDVLAPPYEVVKVAHHGSADQEPALYAEIEASVALVSVGADNSYGHPRAETLAFLEQGRMTVARTDLSGLLAVWPTPDGVTLWRERSPPVSGPVGRLGEWPPHDAPPRPGRAARSRRCPGGLRSPLPSCWCPGRKRCWPNAPPPRSGSI
ncbi:ComEC/Rec2 family competence protein [Microbacterium sp. P01]|uniref:ComEC/Rec2 family competence protein n=1 Tax=Microbacterium sp. P01 TaxID=3366261 RepID=UPI00366DEC1A